MGALDGIRASVAEICYALARQLDSGELNAPAPVARELVSRLTDLAAAGKQEVSRADAIVADVADELAPRRRAIQAPSA